MTAVKSGIAMYRVESYFRALDRGDVSALAALFSADCLIFIDPA